MNADNQIKFSDILEVCEDILPPTVIFSSVKSKNNLDKILVEKFNMVCAEKFELGYTYSWKMRKIGRKLVPRYVRITKDAYLVPFSKNMENLLKNDEIRHCIDNPRMHADGIYRCILDGSRYRQNEFFRNNNNSVGVIIYIDEIGITNPLAGASKRHKLTMIYWTISNIYPELRSTLNAINLYAIVKTQYIKQTPTFIDSILTPLVNEILKSKMKVLILF